MTYLEQVEQLSDKLLALTEADTEKRAFLLVALDDPEEETKNNVLTTSAGTRENVQALIEVLLQTDELVPLIQKAIIEVVSRQKEKININDLLKELKNEN